MHALTKPKYFMPIHGERRHLMEHRKLAMFMGEASENIFVPENGKVLEIDKTGARWNGAIPWGKLMVDGTGIGDVGSVVLRDRILLSQDGLIVVSAAVDMLAHDVVTPPEIYTRGFIYVKESEELMDEMRDVARDALEKAVLNYKSEISDIKTEVRDAMSKFVSKRVKRRPIIMPIIIEV